MAIEAREIFEGLLGRRPELQSCAPAIWQAYEILCATYREGGKLLVCGNGGSAADSEHIVAELMKGFMAQRSLPEKDRSRLERALPDSGKYIAARLQGALPALSLTSSLTLLTAFSNDVDPDLAFAQQVYGYGRRGDTLLAISTSGNSKNVIYAAQVGGAFGLHTLALTGREGGILKECCEAAICVPAGSTPLVQEQHMAVYHTLCAMVEATFFL